MFQFGKSPIQGCSKSDERGTFRAQFVVSHTCCFLPGLCAGFSFFQTVLLSSPNRHRQRQVKTFLAWRLKWRECVAYSQLWFGRGDINFVAKNLNCFQQKNVFGILARLFG